MNLASSALALVFSAALTGIPVQGSKAQQQPIILPLARVETVHEHVVSYFADIPIMASIASCESHFHQFNTDGGVFRGELNTKDVGVMQINEYYHLDEAQSMGINLYTLDGNLEYARHLYEEEGTAPWSSSQYCWSKSSSAKTVKASSTSTLATVSK
jgi:hypothetical protein